MGGRRRNNTATHPRTYPVLCAILSSLSLLSRESHDNEWGGMRERNEHKHITHTWRADVREKKPIRRVRGKVMAQKYARKMLSYARKLQINLES